MSGISLKLRPYDEVTFALSAAGSRLVVDAGWVSLEAAIQADARQWVQGIIDCLPAIDEASQWLFHRFRDYPLFYYLPRNQPDGVVAQDPTSEDTTWFAPQSDDSRWLRMSWPDQCHLVAGAFDPLSIFSCLRRLHLKDLMTSHVTQRLHAKLKRLATSDADRFVRGVALVIAQNLYVTQKAEIAITPALGLYSPTRGLLEHFLASERNHSRLLEASLKTLGKTHSESPLVLTEFVELMKHLESSAAVSLLGFATILDTFESASRGQSDPLAELLEKAGYGEAAQGLKTHHEINKTHLHHQFSESLLQLLPAIDEGSMIFATRLSERNTHLQICGCERLIELI